MAAFNESFTKGFSESFTKSRETGPTPRGRANIFKISPDGTTLWATDVPSLFQQIGRLVLFESLGLIALVAPTNVNYMIHVLDAATGAVLRSRPIPGVVSGDEPAENSIGIVAHPNGSLYLLFENLRTAIGQVGDIFRFDLETLEVLAVGVKSIRDIGYGNHLVVDSVGSLISPRNTGGSIQFPNSPALPGHGDGGVFIVNAWEHPDDLTGQLVGGLTVNHLHEFPVIVLPVGDFLNGTGYLFAIDYGAWSAITVYGYLAETRAFTYRGEPHPEFPGNFLGFFYNPGENSNSNAMRQIAVSPAPDPPQWRTISGVVNPNPNDPPPTAFVEYPFFQPGGVSNPVSLPSIIEVGADHGQWDELLAQFGAGNATFTISARYAGGPYIEDGQIVNPVQNMIAKYEGGGVQWAWYGFSDQTKFQSSPGPFGTTFPPFNPFFRDFYAVDSQGNLFVYLMSTKGWPEAADPELLNV